MRRFPEVLGESTTKDIAQPPFDEISAQLSDLPIVWIQQWSGTEHWGEYSLRKLWELPTHHLGYADHIVPSLAQLVYGAYPRFVHACSLA